MNRIDRSKVEEVPIKRCEQCRLKPCEICAHPVLDADKHQQKQLSERISLRRLK